MQESSKYLEEHVLVFPTTLLDTIGKFQGLSFELERYGKVLLDPKNHSYLKRKEAEINPSFKQLIPYALICCNDSVFVYRRGKLVDEKRLLGNFSLGIGGHISITDPALFGTTYEEGLKRELNEEVSIESKVTQKVAALLNDDSNDVGKVHLGIVHVLKLEKPLGKPCRK